MVADNSRTISTQTRTDNLINIDSPITKNVSCQCDPTSKSVSCQTRSTDPKTPENRNDYSP